MYFWNQQVSYLFVWLVTDHKPLLSLFKEQKAIPQQALGRIQ